MFACTQRWYRERKWEQSVTHVHTLFHSCTLTHARTKSKGEGDFIEENTNAKRRLFSFVHACACVCEIERERESLVVTSHHLLARQIFLNQTFATEQTSKKKRLWRKLLSPTVRCERERANNRSRTGIIISRQCLRGDQWFPMFVPSRANRLLRWKKISLTWDLTQTGAPILFHPPRGLFLFLRSHLWNISNYFLSLSLSLSFFLSSPLIIFLAFQLFFLSRNRKCWDRSEKGRKEKQAEPCFQLTRRWLMDRP